MASTTPAPVAGADAPAVVPDLPDLPLPRRTDDRLVYDAVTYARPLGFRPLLMDVHVPADADGPVPCVVWIHGGAWWDGDRRFTPGNWPKDDHWFRLVVGSGMAVATVDYRLSGEAHHPAQLADAQAAIRFLRHRSADLGIDPDRIGVSGESAGGHLAALVALTGDAPVPPTERSVVGPSSAVAAAVPMYPVTDLSAFGPDGPDAAADTAGAPPWVGPTPEDRLLGRPVGEAADVARAASPVGRVHAGAPPMLLLHGTADTVVPPGHSERLAAALADAGAPVRLELVPGGEHCFDRVDPVPALRAAVDFLAEHLRA
ncbi:alpha/beta hydrolase [uncultured Cellulomonas sp.]|uniref:alpha/beta hydrolase n=1 Tax=uncultured Cellulomonas sp. TaxID=189682 RepID=UPI0026128F8A|nr:alpha/beta hydrolase [uncultured Cellulomonas sp.]